MARHIKSDDTTEKTPSAEATAAPAAQEPASSLPPAPPTGNVEALVTRVLDRLDAFDRRLERLETMPATPIAPMDPMQPAIQIGGGDSVSDDDAGWFCFWMPAYNPEAGYVRKVLQLMHNGDRLRFEACVDEQATKPRYKTRDATLLARLAQFRQYDDPNSPKFARSHNAFVIMPLAQAKALTAKKAANAERGTAQAPIAI